VVDFDFLVIELYVLKYGGSNKRSGTTFNYHSKYIKIMKNPFLFFPFCFACMACMETQPGQTYITPKKIIDLGTVITEDLPERTWGKSALLSMGFTRLNNFEVIDWKFENEAGKITGSNSYFTLFNHGGPHVDSPAHMDLGGGIDSYPIEVFEGQMKVFDVSSYGFGHSVPAEIFKDKVAKDDIVMIYTKYMPPKTEGEMPKTVTLSPEAAEYLATLPVRAFGTDAWSVMSFDDTVKVNSESEAARLSPIHYSFLSRKIPIYEGLYRLDELIGYRHVYFVGAPLNIKDGDGMLVRPVALVFE
jgi:kynurenine formamidase